MSGYLHYSSVFLWRCFSKSFLKVTEELEQSKTEYYFWMFVKTDSFQKYPVST